jgi:YD repeat-containing protein
MTYTEHNDLASIVDALGNDTTMTYGSNGTLATLTNARSAETRFYYEDTAQNLTRSVDALGNETRLSYDENSNVLEVVDGRNNLWATSYDEQNRPLTATDPLQSVRSWSYEGPNLVTMTDENDNETNLTYTACGRLWTVTDALSGVVTMLRDSAGNVISVEDPNENITGFSLDALMRVTTLTRPDGNAVTYAYDALDRLRAVTPPNGNVPSGALSSIITTNGHNLLLNAGAEIANPFNAAQAQNWAISSGERDTTEHASGTASFKLTNLSSTTLQQPSVAAAPGSRTLVNYQVMTDATSGNLTFTSKVLAPPVNGNTSTTQTSSSWNLNVYSEWQAVPPVRFDIPGDGQYDRFPISSLQVLVNNGPSGHNGWVDNVSLCSLSQAVAYDGAGRPIETRAPDGSAVIRVRDRFGRVVGVQDGRGQTTTLTYDSLDRLLTVTTPLGETVAWTYDAVGNVLTFEDGNDNVTTYTTDLLNRLTVISYPDTTEEQFSYDAVSNLVQYTDNNGHVRTLAYDPANRLRLVTYQVDSTTVSLTPDKVGNIIFRTDRNGDVTHQQFDALNRLVYVERNPDGVFSTSQSWMQSNSYDANSNRTEFCNLLPSSYPQYDIAHYDVAQEPAPLPQWQPPSSGAEYNTLNQLLAFRDALDHATTLAYDSIESRLQTITCSNGVSTGLVYDILGRVVSMSTALGSSPLLALAYSYDLNSNRTGCATLTDGFDYGLDADNRLVTEEVNRFVQRSADRFNTGSGMQIDTTSGAVAMLGFADGLDGTELNLDRWRLSYSAPSSSFMGFEIRQDSHGLHVAYPRGFNNQTSYFNANDVVVPPYCHYGLPSVAVWGGCEHRTQVTGDFDIQVEFADIQLQPTSSTIQGALSLIVSDQPMETSVTTPANSLQLQINNVPEYRAVVTVGSSTSYAGTFATTVTSGGLRIARASGVVTFSTLVSGVWTPLSTGTLTFSVATSLYVMLVGYGLEGTVAGTFSDFESNTHPAAYPTSSVFTSSLYDAGPDLAGRANIDSLSRISVVLVYIGVGLRTVRGGGVVEHVHPANRRVSQRRPACCRFSSAQMQAPCVRQAGRDGPKANSYPSDVHLRLAGHRGGHRHRPEPGRARQRADHGGVRPARGATRGRAAEMLHVPYLT